MKKIGLYFLGLLFLASGLFCQSDIIDFDSQRWVLRSADIVNHLGRKSLCGYAYLKDVEFQNGVIEVDVAVDGKRSYPGIVFRMQSGENCERFYLRPHRAGLYPDALQYTPVINKVAGWQLYSGNGFTAFAFIPANRWIHLKMEVHGKQARVYLNGNQRPALVIHDLKHGISKGTVGLMGPKNKTAYFSNFRFRSDNNLKFTEPPKIKPPSNMIMEWEISEAAKANQVDISGEKYPRFYKIFEKKWQKVTAEASGLVDISRVAKRTRGGADYIYARTVVRCDKKQNIKLSFGYSDEVAVFLNGRKVFYGNSAYRYRDPSFVGVVGLHDAVYLTLEKGLNEIFLMVKEVFGGWGFMCRADRKLHHIIKQHKRVEKAWETPGVFLTPESVLYDPKREILYVTSFDNKYFEHELEGKGHTGYISRVKLNGKIENLKWVTGLNAPCGMSIYQDKLYTVERCSLVEIDIKSGKISKRYPIYGSVFLNDIAGDAVGNIYISNTFSSSPGDSCIYKFRDGKFEGWVDSGEIDRANGLFIHGNNLIVGSSGNGSLKSISLADKKIDTITSLGAGVVDGIRVDGKGNYLVSHWEGRTYLISPAGEVIEILDTMAAELNSADFEFIKEKNLLIIPTFLGNRLTAYKLL